MADIWPVPSRVAEGADANIAGTLDRYRAAWAAASNDPDGFWLDVARQTTVWRRPPTIGREGDFRTIKDGPIRWFGDGTLNVTETCVDQWADRQPDKTAILWEGDEPGDVRTISYAALRDEVSRTANALSALGVRKGDRVIIYMGMTPEAAFAMLACARLGAVHSVVFGGFSAESLRDRVRDCDAEVVITQDEGYRGGKTLPLKAVVDHAIEGEDHVRSVLVLRRTGAAVTMKPGRDVWWHDVVDSASPQHTAVECGAEDPLYVLYTSGSTGKPKGVVHTCGGYITYAAFTHKTVFDLRPDDVYACVADVGWVTGHSYIVYGPLANGATTFMFESTPVYPDAGRYWDMVQRHRITIFYTAPTALRVLAAQPQELVRKYDRSSLRVLGTVGEPINPEAWVWYREVVGEGRCAVVDTWWQTETGGIAISPIAPATPTKPGSATLPLPGIKPVVVDSNGHELHGPTSGHLCLAFPWPGQARTVWGDHERFVSTYFATYPGL
ncbi:MAG: acetate--CoA ligase, partial [Myxococcales bacterium]|nr:acetate--CoA ligase [Myxococcales bacterium]